VIIIDKESPIFDKYKSNNPLPGYYVIGVYGNKNSTFTINVHK
jgi:hypothetical protein